MANSVWGMDGMLLQNHHIVIYQAKQFAGKTIQGYHTRALNGGDSGI